MPRSRVVAWIVGACLSYCGWAIAESTTTPVALRTVQLSPEERDIRNLAARIDLHLGGGWVAAKVEPTVPADDAEFLRRVYLELAGRIPSVSEARAFLSDSEPEKRRRLVDSLLASTAYVEHYTNVWRALFLPEAATNIQLQFLVPGFEAWLRPKVAANLGYDQLTKDLLTVSFANNDNRMMMRNPSEDGGMSSPNAFYAAKEAKPESLAASTSRLFLGIRLECAQCHDHPLSHWKREQFWNFAAFFGGFQKRADNPAAAIRETTGTREITIPGKDQPVPALFLDGKEPKFEYKVSNRVSLADWITSPENPYFARTIVNRIWAQFFGLGIVDPVDDFNEEHPPSHPALLDELAREFMAHQYDVKFLIKAITSSRAYQLSSAYARPEQNDPRLFARMAVKSLTPEQLFASVAQATGYFDRVSTNARSQFERTSGPRADFATRFLGQEGRSDNPTTILQALFLMNGNLVAQATALKDSHTLAAVLDAPFLDDDQKIETLYLATLSRSPRPAELARMRAHVQSGGPNKDPKTAYTDLFWALLNTAEFALNH